MQVYKLNNLVPATVLKRPSALIKTPYVSDIQLVAPSRAPSDSEATQLPPLPLAESLLGKPPFPLEDDIEPHLGHSLSLGCCGLCDAGAQVYVTPIPNAKPGLHCDYTVQLSSKNNTLSESAQSGTKGALVGINPRLAEHIVENCIKQKLIIPEIKTYKREYTVSKDILNTTDTVRYDFGGTLDNGAPFYLEVKNVPLASNGVAYFPDGYRKKSTDTVSPRALKHIQELMHIKINNPTYKCIICYVIQRNDVTQFEIAHKDPEYRAAVFQAIGAGVEALAIVIEWTPDGTATFVKTLPVT